MTGEKQTSGEEQGSKREKERTIKETKQKERGRERESQKHKARRNKENSIYRSTCANHNESLRKEQNYSKNVEHKRLSLKIEPSNKLMCCQLKKAYNYPQVGPQ